MVVHLFTADKFTEPYIKFINKSFNGSNHKFYIFGDKKYMGNKEIENVIFFEKNIKLISRIIKDINKSHKIIVHGLFYGEVVKILSLNFWVLKKCDWFIWGADLYYFNIPKNGIKMKFDFFLRKFIIKRFGAMSTQVEGEVELARKWYGARGEYKYSFLYLSNIYKDIDRKVEKVRDRKYIMVGNSADSTNNHLEVFEKLEKYRNDNIELICPLSYGSEEYRKLVIEEGYRIFENKFRPLIEFMEYDKYIDLLNIIDIAIFNHDRQQALGNITNLLGLGKKVYMKSSITTWQFCEKHNLKVFDIDDKNEKILESIDEKVKLQNVQNIKSEFNEDKLKADMKKIFE